MTFTIEEAMCEDQRLDLQLQRELEWESRHNYINSMRNELCQLLPASEQLKNLTEARRCLAQVLTTHDECANEALKTLARLQYEEIGERNEAQLAEFELQLQMQLLKLLQQQSPQLLRWLQSGGEDFALATAITVGAMAGERLPIHTRTASPSMRDNSVLSHSKVKSSSTFDSLHRSTTIASADLQF
jgi:uncharacterized protein YllA (UPF0747 family)